MAVIGHYSSIRGADTKKMYWLTNPADIRNELKTAYSPPTKINRLLIDSEGTETVNTDTEQQLLYQKQAVTVKDLHKKLHRQAFHHM